MQNSCVVRGCASGDVAQPIADQVIQMNAIYGVSFLYGAGSATPSVFSNWVSPTDSTHHYDIVSVMNNATTQASIVAVRVGIVVRGEYYDKNPVSPKTLTLFSGLVDGYGKPLATQVPPIGKPTLDQHYRYRVYEFTVPLRDMIVLAGGP
jgi:type IV pilus assembly protein PilW